MNRTPVQRIKSLIKSLPKDDISIGNRFIETRDFESLQELVNSAMVKVNRNLHKEVPSKKYEGITLEDLSRLKSEVDAYLMLLDPDLDVLDDETSIEENNYYEL